MTEFAHAQWNVAKIAIFISRRLMLLLLQQIWWVESESDVIIMDARSA